MFWLHKRVVAVTLIESLLFAIIASDSLLGLKAPAFSNYKLKIFRTIEMAKTNQSAQKRLLQEVKALRDETSPALQSLGPVSDDNLFEWKAIMRGVPGTAYEGED